jgi:hypothetical protein
MKFSDVRRRFFTRLIASTTRATLFCIGFSGLTGSDAWAQVFNHSNHFSVSGLAGLASGDREEAIEFGRELSRSARALEDGRIVTELRTEAGDPIVLTPVFVVRSVKGVEVVPALASTDREPPIKRVGAAWVAGLSASRTKSAMVNVGVLVGELSSGVMSPNMAVSGALFSLDAGIRGAGAAIGYGSTVTDLQAHFNLQATYSRLYAGPNRGAHYMGGEIGLGLLFLNAAAGVMTRVGAPQDSLASRWLVELRSGVQFSEILRK